MSLVQNPEPSDLRIYRPNFIDGLPGPDELSRSTAHVLRKISSACRKAWRALAISDGACSSSSLCVGLLDPVSNLVINSLVSYKRNRNRVCEEDGEDPERRSLDGMVAFLTRLFPDLAEGQAVRYLFLADADVLVAARILVSDAGMRRFYDSDPAIMEMALLKCAALAAGHPDPDRLVRAWRGMSDRIYAVLGLLDRLSSGGHVPIVINKLRRMLNEGPAFRPEQDASWAWQLAAARRRRLPRRPRGVRYRHTRLLTRTLHDAVHGFYLRALARLPAGELRSSFHLSLLRAGHCYGPLDPVSNIVVNTVWYDAAFPAAKTLELDTIGTESLHRMENRSLYGMVSFLCTRYHRLGFRRAVRRLLQADANLVLADHNLDPAASTPGVEQAFLAAAKAAMHPSPDAQVKQAANGDEIIVFDLTVSSVSTIKLPEGVKYRRDFKSTLSRADDASSVYLIDVMEFQLRIWLHKGDNWLLVDSIRLRQMFSSLGMSGHTLEDGGIADLLIGQAGDNGQFVILHMVNCIFYLDIKCRTLRKVYDNRLNDRRIGSIHPFMMIWPPTFPALKDDPARFAFDV